MFAAPIFQWHCRAISTFSGCRFSEDNGEAIDDQKLRMLAVGVMPTVTARQRGRFTTALSFEAGNLRRYQECGLVGDKKSSILSWRWSAEREEMNTQYSWWKCWPCHALLWLNGQREKYKTVKDGHEKKYRGCQSLAGGHLAKTLQSVVKLWSDLGWLRISWDRCSIYLTYPGYPSRQQYQKLTASNPKYGRTRPKQLYHGEAPGAIWRLPHRTRR